MFSAKIFLFAIPAISAIAGGRLLTEYRRRRLALCTEQQRQDFQSIADVLKAARKDDADIPALAAQYAELMQVDTEGCDLLRDQRVILEESESPFIRDIVEKLGNYA